ncbi:MAG TPA: NrfD/PsrC family molybdoenzyme membrane anchor subunit [Bacteroidota bacterium]|nr:NrfD/PsrC family molybdoenzyme membrane anchor subunit [Bacteroidota bacterium]
MEEHKHIAGFELPPPLVAPDQTYASITDKISGDVLQKKTPRGMLITLGVTSLLLVVFAVSVGYLLYKGIGVWGLNIPVGWAFDITNFVWWIGIGHAGTLISAILLLLHQHWRNAINRFAEAMTLFAVACAGMFPLLHLGRPWLAYWLTPYPNTMAVWPNFRSPLVWDVFAVSTYLLVSFMFWFVGLIPDLASMRDIARKRWQKIIYGILAMGWRGSARHWHRYEMAYLLLAGLATPLVVSVHSVVSFDFAVGILPGWHTTIFPPYFVAGAIYSGFAMVLTLMIPARKMYHLEAFITDRHLDYMAKVMLSTGLIVLYGYMTELFFAYYSGSESEGFMMMNRMTGPYGWAYAALMLCNGITPQFLWFKNVRSRPLVLFIISIVVNIGMWLERFVIIVTSLHRDFLPSSWGMFYPTKWDWGLYLGTLGVFVWLIYMFVRVMPMISIFEIKHLLPWRGRMIDTSADAN